MRRLFLISTVYLVAACGGGGDGGSGNSSGVSTSPPTIKPSTTALKDNTVASTTQFKQFATFSTQIPDKTQQFKSKTIYIKMYTLDGNTLYLGSYLPSVRIPLHVPNHVKSIKIDIFSTDPADPQLTEEIIL